MKKMILLSLLAVSAGPLFGASNNGPAERNLNKLLITIVSAAEQGNPKLLEEELKRLSASMNNNQLKQLLNTNDGMYNALGIIQVYLTDPYGFEGRPDRKIEKMLRDHGADIVYTKGADAYEYERAKELPNPFANWQAEKQRNQRNKARRMAIKQKNTQ